MNNKPHQVTIEEVQAEIKSEFYFCGLDAMKNAKPLEAGSEFSDLDEHDTIALRNTTFVVLILNNGTKVVGVNYGSIDPKLHDAKKGLAAAREQALDKVWELLGFRLRDYIYANENSLPVAVPPGASELDNIIDSTFKTINKMIDLCKELLNKDTDKYRNLATTLTALKLKLDSIFTGGKNRIIRTSVNFSIAYSELEKEVRSIMDSDGANADPAMVQFTMDFLSIKSFLSMLREECTGYLNYLKAIAHQTALLLFNLDRNYPGVYALMRRDTHGFENAIQYCTVNNKFTERGFTELIRTFERLEKSLNDCRISGRDHDILELEDKLKLIKGIISMLYSSDKQAAEEAAEAHKAKHEITIENLPKTPVSNTGHTVFDIAGITSITTNSFTPNAFDTVSTKYNVTDKDSFDCAALNIDEVREQALTVEVCLAKPSGDKTIEIPIKDIRSKGFTKALSDVIYLMEEPGNNWEFETDALTDAVNEIDSEIMKLRIPSSPSYYYCATKSRQTQIALKEVIENNGTDVNSNDRFSLSLTSLCLSLKATVNNSFSKSTLGINDIVDKVNVAIALAKTLPTGFKE